MPPAVRNQAAALRDVTSDAQVKELNVMATECHSARSFQTSLKTFQRRVCERPRRENVILYGTVMVFHPVTQNAP